MLSTHATPALARSSTTQKTPSKLDGVLVALCPLRSTEADDIRSRPVGRGSVRNPAGRRRARHGVLHLCALLDIGDPLKSGQRDSRLNREAVRQTTPRADGQVLTAEAKTPPGSPRRIG